MPTEWRKPIGCLIFIGHFPQKNPVIIGSFAKNDLQLRASYVSSPLCSETEGRQSKRERERERERERKTETETERGRKEGRECCAMCVAVRCSVLQCVAVCFAVTEMRQIKRERDRGGKEGGDARISVCVWVGGCVWVCVCVCVSVCLCVLVCVCV